jgi:hypothetical protein
MIATHPRAWPRHSRRAVAMLALALQACVVVPQTREVYDPECKVMKRQMTLQTAALGSFQSCADEACKAMLVAMGAVTAATAVVSGSVALVGNMLYWFERQGQCVRTVPMPAAAASATALAAPAAVPAPN